MADNQNASVASLRQLTGIPPEHRPPSLRNRRSPSAESTLQPSDPIAREKAGRKLEEEIRQIIEHPVYQSWLRDRTQPTRFRDAGHFWGIAPGTPPKTVRDRVAAVERTLIAAADFLQDRDVYEVTQHRGKILFDRGDIESCLRFQATLKERFAPDLRLLDPGMDLLKA